jgi:ABC-2 type transport system permease protein
MAQRTRSCMIAADLPEPIAAKATILMSRIMRLYYEVALRAFRRATTYRVALLSGLITNAFFGAMLSFIYIGVYGGRSTMAGYSESDAISYLWAAQALITAGSAWITSDLTRSIKSGDVAVDLMRPWNYYAYWLSQQLGEKLLNLLMRGTLTYLVGVLYFGARVPSLSDMALFTPALLLAVCVSTALSFLVNATAFWLIDNSGVVNIVSILSMFLSGFLVPLAFFPPWLAQIARALPFQATNWIPIQVFLGRLRGAELLGALAVQLIWAIVLIGAALAITRAAMQKIVIQGG